jgi:hypothetical protein
MVSLRTRLMIRALTLWNYMVVFKNYIQNQTYTFYNCLRDYFFGYNEQWVLLPWHSLPLPFTVLTEPVESVWVFNNLTKTLTIRTDDETPSDTLYCKFSWLSADLRIALQNDEWLVHNMDDFIQSLTIITTIDVSPTLNTLFLLWCIANKKWFPNDVIVKFDIIDEMGNQSRIDLDEHNNCLQIKKDKIYVVIHDGDNKIIENDSDIKFTALSEGNVVQTLDKPKAE